MLKTPLLGLAPMAGVTDPPLRVLAYRYGADYACTEMVSAMGLCCAKPGNPAYARLMEIWPEEKGTALQLFGSDPLQMAEAAAKVTAMKRFGSIDINMGCPARKIVSGGEGSALLKNPDLAARIMEAVKCNTDLPVTVKTRLGFDEHSMNALALAQAAQSIGLKWICIHGRTREQMYSGKANYAAIAAIREKLTIPVIANGDVFTARDALNALQQTGASGIMIGRGVLGHPQLFREIKSLLETNMEQEPACLEERLDTALEHAGYKIKYQGEKMGMIQMRTHLGHYVSGMRGAAALRAELCNVTTFAQAQALAEHILKMNNPNGNERLG